MTFVARVPLQLRGKVTLGAKSNYRIRDRPICMNIAISIIEFAHSHSASQLITVRVHCPAWLKQADKEKLEINGVCFLVYDNKAAKKRERLFSLVCYQVKPR